MALNLIGGIVGKILPEAGKIIDDLHTSTEEKWLLVKRWSSY